MPKKAKSTAVVVYSGPPKPQRNKRPKKKAGRSRRKIGSGGRALVVKRATLDPRVEMRQFMIALRNPFHPYAIGARVPDSYQVPTVCYHYRGTISLTSDASGNATLILLPSPCFTAIVGTYAAATATITGLTQFTNNTSSYYAVTPSVLATVLTEYRVVSCGFRFVAKDTATNSKGKIFVARVPTTNNAPSWNTLATVSATNADTISLYAAGVTVNNPFTVTNLPGVRTFSMQDLLRGEVYMAGVPTHDTAYEFKNTMDRSVVAWNTGQVLADEGVFNSTTGLVNATAGGRKDVASLRGGCAFQVFATGMPASSQEFDIEFVYHLEGVPNTGGTGQAALIPSAQRTVQGNTSTVEKALAIASRAANLITYASGGEAGAGTSAIMFGMDAVSRLTRRRAPPAIAYD